MWCMKAMVTGGKGGRKLRSQKARPPLLPSLFGTGQALPPPPPRVLEAHLRNVEFANAFRKMSNQKACGPDGVKAELPKCGPGVLGLAMAEAVNGAGRRVFHSGDRRGRGVGAASETRKGERPAQALATGDADERVGKGPLLSGLGEVQGTI